MSLSTQSTHVVDKERAAEGLLKPSINVGGVDRVPQVVRTTSDKRPAATFALSWMKRAHDIRSSRLAEIARTLTGTCAASNDSFAGLASRQPSSPLVAATSAL